MSELRSGTAARDAMLRRKMIAGCLAPRAAGLVPCDQVEAEAFADAFVRISRPARFVEPAPQTELAL